MSFDDCRDYLESRRNSTSDIKGYEIALNPSRFEIVKARLENFDSKAQYEAKYYLEKLPNAPAPLPPTCGESNKIESELNRNISNQYEKILDPHDETAPADKEEKTDNLYATFNPIKAEEK